MKTILVSLISDQTIPNVQLIKEFKSEVDGFLFISTHGMEKKNVRESIIKACHIEHFQLLEPIIVDQFSFDDIEQKLDKVAFEGFERIIVNLTGGTKVMTLAAFNFYKEVGAEIYYLTGKDDVLIKLAPGRKKVQSVISSKVSVKEYLEAYGFNLQYSEPSGVSMDYTKKFCNYFSTKKSEQFKLVIEELRTSARDKRKTEINSIKGLEAVLNEIDFPKREKGYITKYEAKYLTGEWFEEYVANRIQTELGLSDDFIATGLQIKKANQRGEIVNNELDVVFTWLNKIYVIECKTSLITDVLQSDGSTKKKSILSETLYKSDSLKQSFGLFANMSLLTMDNIQEKPEMHLQHLKRADLFGIKVVDKEKLISEASLSSLII